VRARRKRSALSRTVPRALLGGVLLSACVSQADTLVLEDGSTLRGVIRSIAGGKVKVETKFAGLLSIGMNQVTGFSVDSPVHVTFRSGTAVYGKAERRGAELTVRTSGGVVRAAATTVLAVWRDGAPNPIAPPPAPAKLRAWKFELAVDVGGKTGNTEKLTTGAGFKALLARPEDRLMFYARSAYSQENGQTAVDDAVGGVDYESSVGKRQSWYARTELERDRVIGLDRRVTSAAGCGYYFLRRKTHVLRGRIGGMVLHEAYADGRTTTAPGVDVGLRQVLSVNDWGKLVTDIAYTPSVDDAKDYRLYHRTVLDVPLGRSKAWKLRLGIDNEYVGLPSEGSERLDTTYFTRLVLDL